MYALRDDLRRADAMVSTAERQIEENWYDDGEEDEDEEEDRKMRHRMRVEYLVEAGKFAVRGALYTAQQLDAALARRRGRMSDVAGALERMRLAVGETDALAAIAVVWFDDADWSGADPVLVDRAGHLLEVIARSAAMAASKVDSVHAAVADAQPAVAGSGERWDYEHGTAPGGDEAISEPDAVIVQRIRMRCPDNRYEGSSDAELIQLFKRNRQVLARSDEDVIAAMTRSR